MFGQERRRSLELSSAHSPALFSLKPQKATQCALECSDMPPFYFLTHDEMVVGSLRLLTLRNERVFKVLVSCSAAALMRGSSPFGSLGVLNAR